MALESVSSADTQIESNNDEDLEDGEIPSDEDDEPTPPAPAPKPAAEASKPPAKQEPPKTKTFDAKFNKNKKVPPPGGKQFAKYKNPSEDWAGDVEKAIRAALEEDKVKAQEPAKGKKNNRNKNRKRNREESEQTDQKAKEQKRRRVSDEEEGNEDDDEMLFVRGASPVRKDGRDNNSPPRRNPNNDYESYDSSSDYDDRPGFNRNHQPANNRDCENKRGGARGGRRGGKNERGGKNKGRGNARNDRNGRRNQNNDHIQDPDCICLYYMQGKCHRGDDCPFSHNALPPRKMELCKFYLMDCCAKREKCLYMHHDFPCKFFHTGLKCTQGDNCKFSHKPLNEQVKNILLKHLETAPKEILGDFPRLSREGAVLMINNTAKAIQSQSQGQTQGPGPGSGPGPGAGQSNANQKIPSLFELNVQAPNNEGKEEEEGAQPKTGTKERKSPGKKTRWGSDEDRVPYEQIMLLQSANQLGLQLPNAALGLAVQKQLQQQLLVQQRIANMGFYNEAAALEKEREDFTKDVGEDEIVGQAKAKEENKPASANDLDLRQLLRQPAKATHVVSIAEQAASLTNQPANEESDRDEETELVIEMPVEEEDKEKEEDPQISTQSSNASLTSITTNDDREIPSHLPKRAQELFLRIQQQQRAAQDSFKNMEDEQNKEEQNQMQEDWYSDDDDEDDDDEGGNLTIVLKENPKEESELEPEDKNQPSETPSIPQPVAIVDKLGDLSKIDISAEVSKLLSTIKAQSSTGSGKGSQKQPTVESSQVKIKQEPMEVLRKAKMEPYDDYEQEGKGKIDVYSSVSSQFPASKGKREERTPSPKSSPSAPVSRDPRMSRDPRQRREDKPGSSPCRSESKKDSKPLRVENSIYSSGIIAMDTQMDTDLRVTTDQDHRRKDMDLRQRFASDFGDTDLRMGQNFADGSSSSRSDVDLRQMLSLPFKPVPSRVPCTEIEASIASHPPIIFKVYVVDIPRPDYTGLKLSKNDPQVRNDPRLRKIFRLTDADLADSPMSPPPVKPEPPKSPPQVRSDPRRKAMEAAGGSGAPSASSSGQQHSPDHAMPMAGQGMPMPMGGNPAMMGNMGPMGMMGPNGHMMPPMGPNMPPNMGPMGMGMPNMGGMGPNGAMMGPNQMNFDPRFNAQRNNGAGLLGPAPGMGYGPGPDGPVYDGPPNFPPGGNFGNFGPNDGPMMGYGPNGPGPNFGGNGGGDWNGGGNQNQNNRRGGRIRRRNRNRTNNSGNRGNRSPQ